MISRNLAKSLTRYQTPDIRRSIITKVSFERLVSNLTPITYDYQLLKSNCNGAVLESQGIIDERVIGRLTVTL